MPVRMEQDDPQGSKRKNTHGNRPSSGGGKNLLVYLLPLVFKLFKKKPKLTIGLIIVVAIFYFLGGKKFLSSFSSQAPSSFATGFEPNLKKYDQAEVFEPLADNRKNPLPEAYSLLAYCPKRLNQGKQGSCVGWASSYAARSILYAKATGQDPNKNAFSPSYLYNQIALKGCQGAYLKDAMENMHERGVLPFSQFAYDENECHDKPESHELQQASTFKIKGYNRLTKGGSKYDVDLLAIKQNIAQGAPVIIGMMVGGSFMQQMEGKEIWLPTQSDYQQRGFGGHAMCVIGYDDYKNGGAFQIMNSWGEKWGKKGIAYVSYKDFDFFVKEAYGLYPMGDASQPQSSILEAKIGLLTNQNKKYIALGRKSVAVYTTTQVLDKGTKFKMEITNSNACYIYIFGQETDGSSYVLFPYTKKHSPYCGITGTRLFPKDYSMVLDDKGSEDYIAVVLSHKPIDYVALNKKISLAKGSSYSQKLNTVVHNWEGTQSDGGERLSVKTDLKKAPLTAMVVEIKKK